MHTRDFPAAPSAVLPFSAPQIPTPRPGSTPPSAIGTPFQQHRSYATPTYLQNERARAQSARGAPMGHAATAVDAGAVGASDAAADVAPMREAWLEPRLPLVATDLVRRDELLELLFVADDFGARVKQSRTLRAVSEPACRREVTAMEVCASSDESRRSKEALRILGGEGAIDDERTLEQLWIESAHEGGGLRPPLLLVSGDLFVGLDPSTLLQAIVGVVEPLSQGDAHVAEALESARAASQSPWQSGRSVEAAALRLGDVVARSRLELSWQHIVATARRAVLERRAFDKRTLLGGEHLRATLLLGMGPSPVVVYLPMPLSTRLPLYDKLSIRAAVEVHPAQDALESQRFALVLHALARRIA